MVEVHGIVSLHVIGKPGVGSTSGGYLGNVSVVDTLPFVQEYSSLVVLHKDFYCEDKT